MNHTNKRGVKLRDAIRQRGVVERTRLDGDARKHVFVIWKALEIGIQNSA